MCDMSFKCGSVSTLSPPCETVKCPAGLRAGHWVERNARVWKHMHMHSRTPPLLCWLSEMRPPLRRKLLSNWWTGLSEVLLPPLEVCHNRATARTDKFVEAACYMCGLFFGGGGFTLVCYRGHVTESLQSTLCLQKGIIKVADVWSPCS